MQRPRHPRRDGTMRRPTLVKQRTVAIDKDEVDFRILTYRALDSSALTSLGKHCKETHWRIAVGSGKKTIDIQLNVDRSVVGNCEVAVLCDGKQVFPVPDGYSNAAPGQDKASLRETFTWRHPFRGTVKGLGKTKYFEIRPMHLHAESWHPATLKEQMDDGTFRAMVYMPDGSGGEKEVYYPLVQKDNLRERATRKPLVIPERALVLTVPVQDPLHATLQVDQELCTHFFARPTPPPAKPPLKANKNRITLQVNQDRTEVSADVGYSTFGHFLDGEVRAVKADATRTRHIWAIQVGPFAEHVIELAKNIKSNKVYVLTVDSEVLVEAAAEDIESREDWWECQFRLMGEKFLDWDVYETDPDGNALDSKGVVSQKTKYSHELIVSFTASDANLGRAKLHIDNVDFTELPQMRDLRDRDKLVRCPPEALRGTYNLLTPYKVNDQEPDGFAALGKALGGLFCNPGGFFLGCCNRPPFDTVGEGTVSFQPPRAMAPAPMEAGPDDYVVGR